jgi:ribonuclease-3
MAVNADETETFQAANTDRVQRAAAALGIDFHDLHLLRLALTHRSYLNEQSGDEERLREPNERLEFLGDSVLGMLTAEFLYKQFPALPEGRLTAFRTALVRTETLASWARHFGLDELLYLGRGELTDGEIRDRILAGAFEAVLAAIYLDRGIRLTRRFLWDLLRVDAERIIKAGQETNYKGRLQELIQDRLRLTPVYHTVAIEGPAHDRIFTVDVLVDGQPMGQGVGSSKRAAQQIAAREALIRIGEDENEGEV